MTVNFGPWRVTCDALGIQRTNEALQMVVGCGDKLGPGGFLAEIEVSDGTKGRACIHSEGCREVNGTRQALSLGLQVYIDNKNRIKY